MITPPPLIRVAFHHHQPFRLRQHGPSLSEECKNTCPLLTERILIEWINSPLLDPLGPLDPLGGPSGPLGGPSPMSPGPGRGEGAARKVRLCTSTVCMREGPLMHEGGPMHEGYHYGQVELTQT